MRHILRVMIGLLMLVVPGTADALPDPDSLLAEASRPEWRDAGGDFIVFRHQLDPDSMRARSSFDDLTLAELAVARNWIYAKAGNPFRVRWLRDWFAGRGWYHPRDDWDPRSVPAEDLALAARIERAEASLTREQLERHLAVVTWIHAIPQVEAAQWGWAVEGKLVAGRLGRVFVAGDGDSAWRGLSPEILDRQITLADLDNLSRRDLRILRNWIYARRGRPFRSEGMREYFGTLDWYHPDPKYTDRRLTALDLRNAHLIRDLERKLGGPLTDSEDQPFLSGA